MTRASGRARLLEALPERDLTIEALIETADQLLAEIAPEQTRYKVRERPDVRTIRYYVTQGLLPKPFGYEGGRARYGGAHLLRLLFIKKRQAEQHTLARITQELEGRSDEAVLALLFEEETKRFELAFGAVLEISAEVLARPEQRGRIAEELRRIAEELEVEVHASRRKR